MAIEKQQITDRYAVYNADCLEVMPRLADNSIHLSVYSPPFGGLYQYSSSDRDLSNCKTYEEFFAHYEFVVEQIARVTMPGRETCVHCMDVPRNEVKYGLRDFPGDIIRLHEKHGFIYHDRHSIWKEPLRVAIRTRALGLTHRQIVKDSTLCRGALADYLLVFRKAGENPTPVAHPVTLANRYAGEKPVPVGLIVKFKNHQDPKTNKLSHWIFQQYASAFWDDIRIGRVLKYKEARESEEEKHCHPLQLDVVERCCVMWSNPGETVLTPFMGVGTEVYGAVVNGRRGIGIELKASYFRQALKNLQGATDETTDQVAMEFDAADPTEAELAAIL